KDGTTTGILDQKDPLHSRNYGACMCAPRADLIAIGGADEHLDYLGHVCGPYEMTFRLRNLGREEVWHPSELLYHVWHPGQAGHGNYVGPHDGRHMSSTALSILASGRVPPLLENEAIRLLREGSELSREELTEKLIPPSCFQEWTYEVLDQTDDFYVWHATELLGSLRGYNLVRHQNRFYGIPQWWGPVDLNQDRDRARPGLRSADTLEDLKQQVEALDLGEFPVIAKGFGSGIGHRWRKWKATFSLRPYKGYNLLRGGDRFYAVPQSLGTLDLNREEDRTRLEVLSAESVKTLKKKIE
ncbi:MAG: hypothetical protein GWM98_29940, partial [Nitrospinaceae bacterium]|nr:hypothetical protein [Nitrospinaceae bacterium]NIR57918.1 hypothetical protein [Nitrospinaceae bacterium]NIS88376.1 hypothetical protein [Nitrospinaceae bacterium]NIT85254.1 hypothetical protein [Nitrospinaceae bacterium]NIU47407.1 hypothetical protein [Nitrospinaceae bacterium]